MKTIYLARHAKSSWNPVFNNDFDRSLNKRGSADAINIGKALVSLNWIPERIVSSPAVRAKQTCDAYVEALDYSMAQIEWDEDVYEAPTSKLLAVLANLDESIKSILLIGHNPSMESALVHLCGYATVLKHQQADGKIFTTGNVAKITTTSSWNDLTAGEAHLERILRPKEI